MATGLSSKDLLRGESEIATFTASYAVSAADWGVRAHGGGPFAGLFGIKGLEIVGGTLHLTNWRLVFVANAANRFTGSLRVPLWDISATENATRGLRRAVAVTAGDERFEFSLWAIPRFLSALETQRQALDGAEHERARRALARAPAQSDSFRAR